MKAAGSDHLYSPYIGKGQVLLTGPDGNCDHRVNVLEPARYVGIGTMSSEGTSELSYLWRAAHTTRHPISKSLKVGGIGWNISQYNDQKLLKSGKQILRGEFRQLCEAGPTHLYQNPWTPHPMSHQYSIDRYGREVARSEEEEKLFQMKSANIPYSRRATPRALPPLKRT